MKQHKYSYKKAYISIEPYNIGYIICTKKWSDNTIIDRIHTAKTLDRAIIIANTIEQEWWQEDIVILYGIQVNTGKRVYTIDRKGKIIMD